MTKSDSAPPTCERLPKPSYIGLPADEITIMEGHNDRQIFDEQPLTLLGDSIAAVGQVQDVIVNQVSGRYELIDGERRVREKLKRIEAAEAEGIEVPPAERMIQCKVYENLTPLQVFIASDVTDTHKVKLNVIERANKFEKMACTFGYTPQQIAEHEGITGETVSRLRALLKLPEEIQEMVIRAKNPLPIHQARLLLKLPKKEQLAMAKKIAPLDGLILSEAETRSLVQKSIGPALPGLELPGDSESSGDSDNGEYKTAAVQKARENAAQASNESGEDRIAAMMEPPSLAPDVPVEETLKPVKVMISIAGKLSGSKSKGAVIKAATVTLKVGEEIQILPEALDLTSCPGLAKAVETAMAAQKKTARPAGAKKTAKKVVKKTAKK